MSAVAKVVRVKCSGPCGKRLPLDESCFQLRMRFIPGRGSEQRWNKKCRTCTRESLLAHSGERSRRAIAEIVRGGTKRCPRCDLDKVVSLDPAVSEFRAKPRKPGDNKQSFFRTYCKSCDVELAREQRGTEKYQQWKIASREKRIAYSRKWNEAHPERARATAARCYARYKARVPVEQRRATNAAKSALHRAVVAGRVVKPPSCERCASGGAAPSGGKLRAVFRDISVRPARVEWVCYGHFRSAAKAEVARAAADTGIDALEALEADREEWAEIHEENEAKLREEQKLPAEPGVQLFEPPAPPPPAVPHRTKEEHLRAFRAIPYTRPRRADLMLAMALGNAGADPDWEPDYE